MAKTLAKMGHHEKKSVEFSIKPVYFMIITAGSPMDVSLKMNAKKSGFSPLL